MNEKTKEKINTAFKKTVKAAKTKEGLGTIGGATVGGYIGSSIGIAALGTAVVGTLPVAAVGAGIASLWALVGIFLGKWFDRYES